MISQALASTREEVSTINCQSLGLIDYEEALAIQRQLHQEIVEKMSASSLLLLQHPPVFTAGRRTLDSERPIDGSKVIDVDRGG
ncbi:MAG: lipoyl protein ligase domain-containing protein, partial [Actinomycetota bacterium]